MSRYLLCSLSALILASISQFAFAADPPAPTTAPATAPAYVTTPMRVQTLQPQTYIYSTVETTIATAGQEIAQVLPSLLQALNDDKIQIGGAPLLIYHDATVDPTKTFKLDIGFPIAEPAPAKVPAPYQLRKLDPFRGATTVYSGSMMNIGQAWQQLFGNVFPAGLTPTGESREYYLYWEAPNRPTTS